MMRFAGARPAFPALHNPALWGYALFGGSAMPAHCLDLLLNGSHMLLDALGVLSGEGVSIYDVTRRGPVFAYGRPNPAYVSSLRYYADLVPAFKADLVIAEGGK